MDKPDFDPILEIARRWEERAAEHDRRMETDAEYRVAHEAKERAAAAEKLKAERAERVSALRLMLRTGQFPERAIEPALLNSQRETLAMGHVRRFAAQDSRSLLVLAGGVGSGKTTAAAWLAAHLGKRSEFIRAAHLESAGRYDKELRQRWMDARLLVVDDLGAEYADSKGNFLVELDELMDFYYGNRRVLVVTTNLSISEFKNRYGGDSGRIASRIRESGVWGDCGAVDLRRAS